MAASVLRPGLDGGVRNILGPGVLEHSVSKVGVLKSAPLASAF